MRCGQGSSYSLTYQYTTFMPNLDADLATELATRFEDGPMVGLGLISNVIL